MPAQTEQTKQTEQKLYSIKDASAVVKVTPHVLRRWEHEGRICPSYRTPEGHRRYTEEDIQKLIKIKEEENSVENLELRSHQKKMEQIMEGLKQEQKQEQNEAPTTPQLPDNSLSQQPALVTSKPNPQLLKIFSTLSVLVAFTTAVLFIQFYLELDWRVKKALELDKTTQTNVLSAQTSTTETNTPNTEKNVINTTYPYYLSENILSGTIVTDNRGIIYAARGDNRSLGEDGKGLRWRSLYLEGFSVDNKGELAVAGKALFKEDVKLLKDLNLDGDITIEDKADLQGRVYDSTGALTLEDAIEIGGTVTPMTDNTYDLGSPSARWQDLHIGPASLNIYSTTGASGAGSNYTLGKMYFTADELTIATQAIGSGTEGTIAINSSDWDITGTGVISNISGYTQTDGSFTHTGSTSTLDLTGAVTWDTDSTFGLGAASINITTDGGALTLTGDGTNDINIVNAGGILDLDAATLDVLATSGINLSYSAAGGIFVIQDTGAGGAERIAIADNGNITIGDDGTITVFDGSNIIDATNAEALLVRKQGDTSDVFVIDTTQDQGDTSMQLTTSTITTGSGFVINADGLTAGDAFVIKIDNDDITTGKAFNIYGGANLDTSVMSIDEDGDLLSAGTATFGNGTITLNTNTGTAGWINADGSVSFAAGNFTVSTSGNIEVSPSNGLDTNAAGTLKLGQTNATTIDIGHAGTANTITGTTFAGTFSSTTNLSANGILTLDANSNLIIDTEGTTTQTSGGNYSATVEGTGIYSVTTTNGAATITAQGDTLTLTGDEGATLTVSSASDAQDLTLSTTGASGDIVISSVDAVDIDSATLTIDTTGAQTLTAGGILTLTTSAANQNIAVNTGTADFNINTNQFIVDGNGAVTISPSSSLLTLTAATITAASTTALNLGAATIDFNGAATLQYGDGSNFTIRDDGANNIIKLTGTTNLIEFGNATDNNNFTFLGTGNVGINGNLGVGTTAPTKQLEVADDIYTQDNLYVGSTTEAITNAGFSLDGDDAYIADLLGVGDTIYAENNVIIGSGTLTLGTNAITASGALTQTFGAGSAFSLTDGTTSFLGIDASGAATLTPTAGQNLNIALSTTGDFAVNTNQLYVDTSSGNVGVGTTAPGARLSIRQVDNTGTFFTIVGSNSTIGTITGSASGGYFNLIGNRQAINIAQSSGRVAISSETGNSNVYGVPITMDAFVTNKLSIFGDNVGIGTTNPSQKLQVVGTALVTTLSDGTATLSSGTLDLGTNTIYDGNLTGSWAFNNGGLSGIAGLSASGTITLSGLGTGTDNTVVILNSSNQLTTDEIDPDVWTAGTLLDGNGTANYLPYYSDADTLAISNVYYDGTNVGIGTTGPSQLLSLQSAEPYVYMSSSSDPNYNVKQGISYDVDNMFRLYVRNTQVFGFDYYGTMAFFPTAKVGIGYANPGTAQLAINGNVGIGTTGPGYKLDVSVSTATANGIRYFDVDTEKTLWLGESYGNYGLWGGGGVGTVNLGASNHNKENGALLTLKTFGVDVRGGGYNTGGDINLYTWNGTVGDSADTARLTVKATSGNVGIGTTSPSARLDIEGGSISDVNQLRMTGSAGFVIDNSGRIQIAGTTNDYTFEANGGNTELMRIKGSGNVGIGTTNPLFTLDVNGTANIAGALTTTGNILPNADDQYDLGSNTYRWQDLYLGPATLHIGTSTADEYTMSYDTSNNRLGFNVNGSGNDEIVFDSSGNVGIGTTAPGYKLEVNGNSFFGSTMYLGEGIGILSWGGTPTAFRVYGDTSRPLSLGSNGVVDRLYMDTAGNVGIGTTGPGYLLDVNGAGRIGTILLSGGYIGTGTNTTLGIRNQGSQGAIFLEAGSATKGLRLSGAQGGNIAAEKVLFDYTPDLLTLTGSFTTQRFVSFHAPDASTGAFTITNAATVAIGGPPTAAGGATITNPYSLWVESGTSLFSGNAVIGYAVGTTGPASGLAISGNVGIGTTAPSSKLHTVGSMPIFNASGADTTLHHLYVLDTDQGAAITDWRPYAGNTTAALQIQSTATNGLLLLSPTSGNANLIIGGQGLDIYTDATLGSTIGTRAMTIKSGNVGIGTTGPGTLLEVYDANGIAGEAIRVKDRFGQYGGISVDSAGTYFGLGFWFGGTKQMTLESNGGLLIGSTYAGLDAPANGLAIQGNVGIGTTGPAYKLQVIGGAIYTDDYIYTNFIGPISGSTLNSQYGTILGPAGGFKITGGTSTTADLSFQTTNGVGATGADMHFLVGNNGATEALTILNSGNVGIGTTGPTSKLDVRGLQVIGETADSNRLNQLQLYADANGSVINSTFNTGGTGTLRFQTADNEKMRLSNAGGLSLGNSYVSTDPGAGSMIISGNVGIGTTAPRGKLEVAGGDSYFTGTSYQRNYFFTESGSVKWGLGIQAQTDNNNEVLFQSMRAGGGTTWLSTNEGANVNFHTNTLFGGTTASGITANTRVDIKGSGSTSSTKALYVRNSSDTGLFVIDNSGNVGIGTTGPAFKLDINAGFTDYIRLSGSADGARGLAMFNTAGGASTMTRMLIGDSASWSSGTYGALGYYASAYTQTLGSDIPSSLEAYSDGSGGLNLTAGHASGAVRIFSGGMAVSNERVRITSAGNVGIGTTAPASALHVNGAITSNGTLISTTSNTTTLGNTYSAQTLNFGTPAAGGTLNLNTGANVTSTINFRNGSIFDNGNGTLNYTGLNFHNYNPSADGGYYFKFYGTNNVGSPTSGTAYGVLFTGMNQTAAAGNGNYNPIGINYTINNSGAQTGTVNGILLNATETNLNGVSHNLLNLQVGGTSKFLVQNSGNVGIGTTGPSNLLSVGSSSQFQVGSDGRIILNSGYLFWATGPANTLLLGDTASSNWAIAYQKYSLGGKVAVGISLDPATVGSQLSIVPNSASTVGLAVRGASSQTADLFQAQNSSGTSLAVINSSGNVGIGTTGPGQKLEVKATNPVIQITNNAGQYSWLGVADTANWLMTGQAAGDTGLRAVSGKLLLAASGGESDLVISTGGNIGIGTTGPAYKLHVKDTATTVRVESTSNSSISYYNLLNDASTNAGMFLAGSAYASYGGASSLNFFNQNAAPIAFMTSASSTPQVLINSSGNVGIGTTGPGEKLEVNGNIEASWAGNAWLGFYASATDYGYMRLGNGLNIVNVQSSDATNDLSFYTGTGSELKRMFIEGTAGDVGLGGSISTGLTGATLVAKGSGNVGIGTTGPSSELDVNGTLRVNTIYIDSSNTSSLLKVNYIEQWNGNNNLTLRTESGTNKNIILLPDGSGNVGIGTTGPSQKLDVSGSIQTSGTFLYGSGSYGLRAVGTETRFDGGSTFPASYRFDTTGVSTGAMVITNAGNVGIGTTNPLFTLDVNGTANIAGALTTTGNILPNADDQYDLGSNVLRWQDLYLGPATLHIGTSTADEYTMSYDTTNNRLGFNVNGSGNDEIVFDSSGNVGIGTTGPGAKLEIGGGVTGAAPSPVLKLSNYYDNAGDPSVSHVDLYGGTYGFGISGDTLNLFSNLDFNFLTGTTSRMVIKSGNVGIGTTAPGYKLDVTGTIRTTSYGIVNGVYVGYGATSDIGNATDGSMIRLGGTSQSDLILKGVNTGNVGIGTMSPARKLEVAGGEVLIHSSTGGSWTPGQTGILDVVAQNGTNAFQVWDDNDLVTPKFIVKRGGNVGIGTTGPSQKLDVRGGNLSVIRNENSSWLANSTDEGETDFTNNAYLDGTTWKYVFTDEATKLQMYQGKFTFSTAAEGTAGNAITFSDKVTIDNSGNVGIGTTGPGSKLQVVGSQGTGSSNFVSTAGLFVSSGGAIGLAFGADGNVNRPYIQSGYADTPLNMMLNPYGGDVIIGSTTDNGYAFQVTGGTTISGNVGIGTTSPTQILHVANSSGPALRIERTGFTGTLDLTADGTNVYIDSVGAARPILFRVNSVEKMRVHSDGNVGIGTTGPGAKLGFAAATTAAGGIDFGGDTNLYRSAANTLYTDDSFSVAGTTFTAVQSAVVGYDLVARNAGAAQMRLGASGPSSEAGLTFGSAEDTNLYRLAANTLRTSDSLIIDGNVGIGTTNPTYGLDVQTADNVFRVKATSGGSGQTIAVFENDSYTSLVVGKNNLSTIVKPGLLINGNNTTDVLLRIKGVANQSGDYLQVQDSSSNGLVTVNSSGNVGVGTTGPSSKLEVVGGNIVVGDSYGIARKFSTSFREMLLTGGTGYGITRVRPTDNSAGNGVQLEDYAGNARLFVDATNGNVGIGTTGPGAKLQVSGTVDFTGGNFTKKTTSGAAFVTFGDGTASILGATSITTDRGGTTALSVSPSATGHIGLAINGFSGQTANLLNITSSGGSAGNLFNVTATGNVGIGTTNPLFKLDVNGTANIAGALTVTGNILPNADDQYDLGSNTYRWQDLYLGPATLHIGTSTSDEYTMSYDTTNNRLGFNVNGSGNDEIVFDSSGRIGIGSTNPSEKLAVTGNILIDGQYAIKGSSTSGMDVNLVIGNTNGSVIIYDNGGVGSTILNRFWNDGTVKLANDAVRITSSGNVGIGTTGPGYKLEVNGTSYISGTVTTGSTLTTGGSITIPSGSRLTSASGNLDLMAANTGYIQLNAAIGYVLLSQATSLEGNTLYGGRNASGNLTLDSTNHATKGYVLLNPTSGNVGIGTTGPGARLDLGSNSGNTSLLITDGLTKYVTSNNSAGSVYEFGAGTRKGIIYANISGWSLDTQSASIPMLLNQTGGNVGIGTTGPSYLLHLSKSAPSDNVSIAVDNTSTSGTSRVFARANLSGSQSTVMMQGYGSAYVGNNSFGQAAAGTAEIYGALGNMTIGNAANANLYFGTNALIRMTVQSDGNVGIGTTGPGALLDVRGTAVSNLILTEATVAHGMTGWAPTTAYASLGAANSVTGGVQLSGFTTNVGVTGLRLNGFMVADPTDSVPAVIINGGKANGTAEQALGALETVLQIQNGSLPQVTILGSGNVGIGTTGPTEKLDVIGNAKIRGTLRIRTSGDLGNLNISDNGGGTASISNTSNSFLDIGSASSTTISSGDFLVGYAAGTTVTGGDMAIAGNVGIGTTAPGAKLDILGKVQVTSDAQIKWGGTASDFGMITWDTGRAIVQGASGKDLSFGANSVYDQLYIKSGGNVGIGTTGPGSKLSVAGVGGLINSGGYIEHIGGTDSDTDPTRYMIGFSHGNSLIDSNVRAGIGMMVTPGGAGNLVFETGSGGAQTERMRINGSGNVGIGTTGPNYKLVVNDTNNTGLGYLGFGYSSTDAFKIGRNNVNGRLEFTSLTGTGEYGFNFINGNVGIGTTNPAYKLQVIGTFDATTITQNGSPIAGGDASYGSSASSPDNALYVVDSGNLGIGTTVPGSKLEVAGNYLAKFNSGSNEAVFKHVDAAGSFVFSLNRSDGAGGNGNDFVVKAVEDLHFATNNTDAAKMTILNTGNVGIGTTGPGQLLSLSATRPEISLTTAGDSRKARVANYAGGMNLTGNVYFDGTNWNLDDTAQAGSILSFGTNLALQVRGTAAGTNPRTLTEYLRIDNTTGNVGIGTTAPSEKLAVAGNATITGSLQFGTSGGPNAYALGIRAGSNYRLESLIDSYSCTSSGNGSFTCDNSVSFSNAFTATPTVTLTANSTGTTCGAGSEYITSVSSSSVTIRHNCGDQVAPTTISGNDHILAVGTDNASDLAEWYGSPDKSLAPGHLVAVDTQNDNSVVKTSVPYDPRLIGGVPIKPAIQMGSSSDFKTPVLVALAGRIPVRVTGENGAIRRGDYITSSSKAGFGMKATKAGNVVGRALEEFIPDSPTNEGEVLTFVAPEYVNPASADLTPFLASVDTTNSYEEGDLISIVSDNMFEKSRVAYDTRAIGVFGYTDGKPTALSQGQLTVKVSTVNGDIKAGDLITTSSTAGIGVKALKAGQIVGKALESYSNKDVNKVGKIKVLVNLAWNDPDAYLSDISGFNLTGSVVSSTLGETVSRVGIYKDIVAGKVNVGLLDVQDLTVNGLSFSLTKDKIGQLESKFASLEERLAALEANSSSDEVYSSSEGAERPSREADEAIQSSQSTPSEEMLAIFNEFKAFVETLGMSSEDEKLTISSDMIALGTTTLSDVTVTGDLSVGLMKMDSLANSLDVLGASCWNAELGVKNTELCGAQTLYLQKGLSGNVDLFDGAIVLEPNGQVNINGSLSAIRVLADEYAVKGASTSIGSGVLKAGDVKVVIESTAVREGSKVFVTATSSTGGQSLIVSKKVASASLQANENDIVRASEASREPSYFEITIDNPVGSDITFDWWVLSVN